VAKADPGAPDPADRPEDLDLQRAIERLEAADRALLALRYEAGLDSAEIGALAGRPSSTIRWRLARVLARLRKELSDA
jgi:RNA polymerase sigma factor (sigma-70 family)